MPLYTRPEQQNCALRGSLLTLLTNRHSSSLKTPSTPPYGIILSRHSLTSPNALAPGAPTAPQGQSTSFGKPFEVRYDKLVIAVGAYSQTFNIPGQIFFILFPSSVS